MRNFLMRQMVKTQIRALNLKERLKELKEDEAGASLVEYIILVVFIVIVAIVVVKAFGSKIVSMFTDATEALE